MDLTAAADYLDPYRDAHQVHGSDFGVTLWANPKSQRVRFEVMAQMFYFQGKRILDAGCSRGDFAEFLLERSMPYQSYVGIDGLCEVIEYAQRRNLPDASFICGDMVANPALLATGEPQVVVISGTLNTMEDATALRVLDAAWNAAGEALLFNFLSDHCTAVATEQEYPARRMPLLKLLDWALAQTWAVQLRHDYFRNGHDATILMRKV